MEHTWVYLSPWNLSHPPSAFAGVQSRLVLVLLRHLYLLGISELFPDLELLSCLGQRQCVSRILGMKSHPNKDLLAIGCTMLR